MGFRHSGHWSAPKTAAWSSVRGGVLGGLEMFGVGEVDPADGGGMLAVPVGEGGMIAVHAMSTTRTAAAAMRLT